MERTSALPRSDLPGTKVVVGGGPQLDVAVCSGSIRWVTFPDHRFGEEQERRELARCYGGADVC